MSFLDRLQTLGKKLKESRLPQLGGLILGETPLGKVGRIVKGAAEILGTDEDPDAIAAALEGATPEQRLALLELAARETEAREETARNEQDNLTARHAADMAAQSWLSRNVRPVTLMALLAFWALWCLGGAAMVLWQARAGAVDAGMTGFLETVGMQIVGLLGTVVAFYFGSRAAENLRLGKLRDRGH